MHVSPTGSTTIDNAATTAQPPVPRATSQPIPPRDSIARTDASDRHLPHGFPLARIIELAAAAHGIDPKLPAAVGEQESGMGRGAGYDRTTHVGADGHGHGIWQMDDRFHAMRDAVRADRGRRSSRIRIRPMAAAISAKIPSLRDPAPSAVARLQRPPGILVGRSHVRVIYWYGVVSGRRVKISDAIVSELMRRRH